MTMPSERFNAVLRTEQFLKDLMDPKRTPRVPKSIRDQAYSCLRHYPGHWDMQRAAEDSPQIFATDGEALSTWLTLGKESIDTGKNG